MDYIIDIIIRTQDYRIVDKIESVKPEQAIHILITKYNIKWNKAIEHFKQKEKDFKAKDKWL